MRIPLIAGNWKMNTTIAEATTLVWEMLTELNSIENVEKVFCPPFVSLAAVAETLKGSRIKLGAQNMHFAEKGAYTGEVSPPMLAGLCSYVIVGHSERRQYFNDTDEIVNKKLKAALRYGLTPILCIGEKLEENTAGRTADVVSQQLELALAGIDTTADMVIAYEPIWAIGSGKSATSPQANDTIGFIRNKVASILDKEVAGKTRILYGGSVTADNITEFMQQAEIDGALVGGASLKAEQFISIVKQSAAAGSK
jgi:triosephosphate isomerase